MSLTPYDSNYTLTTTQHQIRFTSLVAATMALFVTMAVTAPVALPEAGLYLEEELSVAEPNAGAKRDIEFSEAKLRSVAELNAGAKCDFE